MINLKIDNLLKAAATQLAVISNSASLDAEILLCHVLNVNRSYLYTWPEKIVSATKHAEFLSLIQRRLQQEPIAYITGHQSFWNLDLTVTPDTLIPRPETELLVQITLDLLSDQSQTCVADLGTGCGAVALALASEQPQWNIIATDNSSAALNIAQHNAVQFNLSNVQFRLGHWCEALPSKQKFDAIVSNPPYIEINDSALAQDVFLFEPHTALFSQKNGLADLQKIIEQAKYYLKQNGWLILEHGYQQAEKVRELLLNLGYENVASHADLARHLRVSIGTNLVEQK